MEFHHYLAMTPGEMHIFSKPERLCWMACHFSADGTGLQDLPKALPAGSMLILNDRFPMEAHDSEKIALELSGCARDLRCSGILLDFERPWNEKTAGLVRRIRKASALPLAVSEQYANGLDCAVFLSPIPPDKTPQACLRPWRNREVWLETALQGLQLELTGSGCTRAPLPPGKIPRDGFSDKRLHCHYRMEVSEGAAVFSLWRTREDLEALLTEARALGVRTAVGLYQELVLQQPASAV